MTTFVGLVVLYHMKGQILDRVKVSSALSALMSHDRELKVNNGRILTCALEEVDFEITAICLFLQVLYTMFLSFFAKRAENAHFLRQCCTTFSPINSQNCQNYYQ